VKRKHLHHGYGVGNLTSAKGVVRSQDPFLVGSTPLTRTNLKPPVDELKCWLTGGFVVYERSGGRVAGVSSARSCATQVVEVGERVEASALHCSSR